MSKQKRPWQMTKNELKQWEFDVPAGGGSKSPKTVLNWKRDEYETLADLANQGDEFRFDEALGKGWERDGVPRTTYLKPSIRKGEKITIYRSSDTGDIVPGSYVSESLKYVQEHGERSIPNKKWKIYKTEVYPDELMTYGDPHEFIYIPKDVEGYHKEEIRKAREQGKRIPKKVLREYEGAWATQFMEGYNKMGKVNFMDKRDRLIDGVSVNLSDYEENDKVIKIWTVMSRVHGQGSGSKVLEKLKALADETKTSIVLKPGAWGLAPVLTVSQLKEWYMRHGFKEMKNGWLIYKPKGVTVKVNLEKHLGAGFWAKRTKRKASSKPRAGRMK